MKKIIFTCPEVPVLQNKVYNSLEAAKCAAVGDLEICFENNFGWNNRFGQSLVKYDDQYDNSVPSSCFYDYYDRIADYLARNYDLSSGPIIDVGCGKGTFLKRMASRYKIRGIGIDPSYEGKKQIGNLTFISEKFHESHIDVKPSLVLCRHTLEHIPDPTSFLVSIFGAFDPDYKFPVFCEVPNLNWIIENGCWYDFCYEHVNYFTDASFKYCLQSAGCSDVKVITEFGEQYLWGEGFVNAGEVITRKEIIKFPVIGDMNIYVTKIMKRLEDISFSRKLVIWGMATKGVMYALHAARQGVNISYGVDINKDKQGKFAPVSGLEIYAPESLPVNERYAVVCMNPNYMSEIRMHLLDMNLNFILIEA